jgi:hypothetical protein
MMISLHEAATMPPDLSDALWDLLGNTYSFGDGWARPQWHAVAWDAAGTSTAGPSTPAALAHVGIILRRGECDGCPVVIGGLCGGYTRSDVRQRGLYRQAMRSALDWLRTQNVAFTLFVTANPHVEAHMGKLGFTKFGGVVTASRAFGETVFVCPGSVMPRERIELRGLPW